MLDKIKAILGSVRFWIISFSSISAYLGFVELNGFEYSSLFNAISIWLGVVAGVGTIDKISTSLDKK